MARPGRKWARHRAVNAPAGRPIACAPQQARYVRIDVTQDTRGHAYLIEAEVLAGGKKLEVASVRASSAAEPVLPKHVKTVKQRNLDRLKQYGPRYLGEAVLEWDNDMSYTWINPQLRGNDKQQAEMMRNAGLPHKIRVPSMAAGRCTCAGRAPACTRPW